MDSRPPELRSKTWYLLPIFMNILGGVIAYFAIRHDDLKKAKRCLIIGASIFSVTVAIGLGFLLLLPNAASFVGETIYESTVELQFEEEEIKVIMNSQAQNLAIRNDPIVIQINNIVQANDILPKESSSDLRILGIAISGAIKAGTYITENDNKEFWFVKTRDSNRIITIELDNNEFDRIVLESEKSTEWIEKINKIISSSKD
jgi:hypothetical protein